MQTLQSSCFEPGAFDFLREANTSVKGLEMERFWLSANVQPTGERPHPNPLPEGEGILEAPSWALGGWGFHPHPNPLPEGEGIAELERG